MISRPVSASAILLAGAIAGCAPMANLSDAGTPTRISPIRAERQHEIAIGRSTRADVIAALGQTLAIAFDSGYEVWVYRLANEQNSEFVLLFAPSGVLIKTRVRQASR